MVCGDDGVGGSCGTCGVGESCSAAGQCEADVVVIPGCMEVDASNHNPSATVDNGSCLTINSVAGLQIGNENSSSQNVSCEAKYQAPVKMFINCTNSAIEALVGNMAGACTTEILLDPDHGFAPFCNPDGLSSEGCEEADHPTDTVLTDFDFDTTAKTCVAWSLTNELPFTEVKLTTDYTAEELLEVLIIQPAAQGSAPIDTSDSCIQLTETASGFDLDFSNCSKTEPYDYGK